MQKAGSGRRGPGRARGSLALAALVSALVFADRAMAQVPAPRQVHQKPAATVVGGHHVRDRIVVKFADGDRVRMHRGGLRSGGRSLAPVRAALVSSGIDAPVFRRMLGRAEADLDAERARAERRVGRRLADLNGYFELRVPPGLSIAALCDALNALEEVEIALPMPAPAPPPVDLLPPTPDFTANQDYRAELNLAGVVFFPGADGGGVTVVDVEYAWTPDHEDLELDTNANVRADPPAAPAGLNDPAHGTAVLGVIGGRANGYGVIGLAPASTLRFSPTIVIAASNYNVGAAISDAAAVLGPGDVVVVEQQLCACGDPCSSGQNGLGPVEDFDPWYSVIETTVALGIHVIAAAGNGNLDLDDASCESRFDRSFRDSGAILVGGGKPGTHFRDAPSNYGSRLDVQAWSENVTGTGYGDLSGFDPNGDPRQDYTDVFSGTSSATAIVAGVVAVLEGIQRAAGSAPLEPEELRALLAATGFPQPAGDATSFPVGPFPDVGAAAAGLASPVPVMPFIRARPAAP